MTDIFKHRISIQLRFSDTDIMGHVNNANYLSYVELARLEYFGEAIGRDSDWYNQRGLIMARFEIDYKKPLFYQDEIHICTRCSRIGTKSFDSSWQIIRTYTPGSSEVPTVAAEGKTILVCYDYESNQPIAITHERRESLIRFEGGKLSG